MLLICLVRSDEEVELSDVVFEDFTCCVESSSVCIETYYDVFHPIDRRALFISFPFIDPTGG